MEEAWKGEKGEGGLICPQGALAFGRGRGRKTIRENEVDAEGDVDNDVQVQEKWRLVAQPATRSYQPRDRIRRLFLSGKLRGTFLLRHFSPKSF